MKKARLDILLVERGLASNRDEAQRLIRAGQTLVEETVRDKPGEKIDIEATIRVQRRETVFASRGGIKLSHALDRFAVRVEGRVCADLGASTGGFTDCLLRRGAAKVFAVDVGHGQLAYSLQTDPRVVVMDRVNCRYLSRERLGEDIDLVVGDLSFISVRKVFSAIAEILAHDGEAVLLIKPQFEIGKGKVGKKGLVRDPDSHIEVLRDCFDFFIREGWIPSGIAPSPITGKTGNLEFFLRVARDGVSLDIDAIDAVVQEAHRRERAEQV